MVLTAIYFFKKAKNNKDGSSALATSDETFNIKRKALFDIHFEHTAIVFLGKTLNAYNPTSGAAEQWIRVQSESVVHYYVLQKSP